MTSMHMHVDMHVEHADAAAPLCACLQVEQPWMQAATALTPCASSQAALAHRSVAVFHM